MAAASGGRAVLTFTKAKLLAEEGKSRDVTVRLDHDALRVLNGDATITSAPYRTSSACFIRTRASRNGRARTMAPVVVGKVDGKFGFLKGAPDWSRCETQLAFIPLRVQDRDLRRSSPESRRTGTKVVHAR